MKLKEFDSALGVRKHYPDLVWLLRAFAQEPEVQFDLYQSISGVTDDLALDFETAILLRDDNFLERNPDIKAFDDLLGKHSGEPEYWTEEALRNSLLWKQLRAEARAVLEGRGISKLPLEPLNITFVKVDDVAQGVWGNLKAMVKKVF